MEALKEKIQQIIDEIVCGKYTGGIGVDVEPTDERNSIYSVAFFLGRYYTPLILSYEGTESEFLDFVCTELKKRKLHDVDFYKLHLEPKYIKDNGDKFKGEG